MQRYVFMPGIPASSRKAISKIRLSSHKLQIECGGYTNTVRTERTCPVSQSSIVEDEYHYIRVCPLYSELRLKYIQSYYFVRPSMWKLILLLSNTDNYEHTRKVLDESNTAQGQLHNLMGVYLCVFICIVCNCCYVYSHKCHLAFG
jgi:hypothetical protein